MAHLNVTNLGSKPTLQSHEQKNLPKGMIYGKYNFLINC